MAIELSLDAIDDLAQSDYADILIPLRDGKVVTLVHPLRMPDDQKDAFQAYFENVRDLAEKAKKAEEAAEAGEEPADEPDAEETSILEQSQELLSLVAKDRDASDLIEALGDDVTRYQAVVSFYFETVNPGEA